MTVEQMKSKEYIAKEDELFDLVEKSGLSEADKSVLKRIHGWMIGHHEVFGESEGWKKGWDSGYDSGQITAKKNMRRALGIDDD